MRPVPSRRLLMLNAILRNLIKPKLARTPGPLEARIAFDRAARLGFRRPPFLLHLVDAGSPKVHWISSGAPKGRRVILYFHGGAYFAGSPWTHCGLVGRLSRLTRWRAAMPEYRRAPEHPAPAAFEDARAAHDRLMGLGLRADEIVLAGDSAGGGLALALLADLCARGRQPAGAVVFSPWVDLTLSGVSLSTNATADPIMVAERAHDVAGYVLGTNGVAADDPRVSPLFAAFASPPPVLLHVGASEVLRDDAVRMADRLRKSGGRVLLEEWPDVPHAWQLFDGWIPEARDALRGAAAFIQDLDRSSGPQQG